MRDPNASSSLTVAPAPEGRVASLDGVRAVAVTLVLASHLVPGLAGAGSVGVDVFFALSGLLITGLLVDEYVRTGSIDLRTFTGIGPSGSSPPWP